MSNKDYTDDFDYEFQPKDLLNVAVGLMLNLTAYVQAMQVAFLEEMNEPEREAELVKKIDGMMSENYNRILGQLYEQYGKTPDV